MVGSMNSTAPGPLGFRNFTSNDIAQITGNKKKDRGNPHPMYAKRTAKPSSAGKDFGSDIFVNNQPKRERTNLRNTGYAQANIAANLGLTGQGLKNLGGTQNLIGISALAGFGDKKGTSQSNRDRSSNPTKGNSSLVSFKNTNNLQKSCGKGSKTSPSKMIKRKNKTIKNRKGQNGKRTRKIISGANDSESERPSIATSNTFEDIEGLKNKATAAEKKVITALHGEKKNII